MTVYFVTPEIDVSRFEWTLLYRVNRKLDCGVPVNTRLDCGVPVNTKLDCDVPVNTKLDCDVPVNTKLDCGVPVNTKLDCGVPVNTKLDCGVPVNIMLDPHTLFDLIEFDLLRAQDRLYFDPGQYNYRTVTHQKLANITYPVVLEKSQIGLTEYYQ